MKNFSKEKKVNFCNGDFLRIRSAVSSTKRKLAGTKTGALHSLCDH